MISSVFLGNLRAVESKRFPASKSKWWLEDFWMMMMMMIVVVVVMMIMTRFQTCDYTRILGDAPFNFCCTFAFFLWWWFLGIADFSRVGGLMKSLKSHGFTWKWSCLASGFPWFSRKTMGCCGFYHLKLVVSLGFHRVSSHCFQGYNLFWRQKCGIQPTKSCWALFLLSL